MNEVHSVYLSLIIPAFNEEARIEKSLDRIVGFLQSQPYASEIIVIDDGSQDRTVEAVRERYGRYAGITVYPQARHVGKGGCVKQGMLLGAGEYLFFSDADLSVPIETLPRFLAYLETRWDVTIGTRQHPDAVIEVRQPFYREFLGRTFTKLSNGILGLQVSDCTCGFKGFRREVARHLFSLQRLNDWSFDAEILYLARLHKYQVLEIPVTWRNDQKTKVRLLRDIVMSLLGLVKIRLYRCLWRYR